MKKTYLLLCLLFSALQLFSQSNVNGNIVSHDTAKVSVIRIFPDSFPNISVIFKAETPSGKPIWNLSDTSITISEDDKPCKIVSLNKVSTNKQVNTALVLDHSGSMCEDEPLRNWRDNLPPSAFKTIRETYREFTKGEVDSDSMITVRLSPPTPDWYHTPLWYAQHAALTYITTIDPAKDPISIIGFSDDVDKIVPLTKTQTLINSAINNLQPIGGTALYDAVDRALDQLEKADGLKAVVVMTDGEDNTSKKSLASVIQKANKLSIPVFVIGLGDVNKKVLKHLANETGGVAYFTDKKEELSSIYLMISKRIQSIYEVVYESPSLAFADTSRETNLHFDVDGQYLDSRNLEVNIPEEVMMRLKQKQETASTPVVASNNTSDNSALYISGGIILLLAGAGTIVLQRRKNQKKNNELIITNIYPNPTAGPFTLNFQCGLSETSLQAIILDSNGQTIFTQNISPGINETQIDLSEFSAGNYSAMLKSDTNVSTAKQIVLTK